MAAEEQLLWNARTTAKALGIGERTLWRLAATGEFPPGIRVGGCTRWPAEAVRVWIAQKHAEAEGRQAALRKSS